MIGGLAEPRWKLDTLAADVITVVADVIAGYREESNLRVGGKELEEGEVRRKLDEGVEGSALSVMLLSACCGDVWAVSYRTKFQEAFSCRRLSVYRQCMITRQCMNGMSQCECAGGRLEL